MSRFKRIKNAYMRETDDYNVREAEADKHIIIERLAETRRQVRDVEGERRAER